MRSWKCVNLSFPVGLAYFDTLSADIGFRAQRGTIAEKSLIVYIEGSMLSHLSNKLTVSR